MTLRKQTEEQLLIVNYLYFTSFSQACYAKTLLKVGYFYLQNTE